MTRLLALTTATMAIALVALILSGGAHGDSATTVVMDVGDVMEVEGAAIGCKVVLKGGRPVVDCRRAGSLAGTYGTLFDERRVRVARFTSSDTAKVVFKAKHRGSAKRCDDAKAGRASR
jgi:hypothetical protein